jgi:hypothetical protein
METARLKINGQDLNDGGYTHTWSGERGTSLLSEEEFHFWRVLKNINT